MKTGKLITEAEYAKVLEMRVHAENAPVMTVRSDLPTFAESARKDYFTFTQGLAVKYGLADGSFYYGIDGDREITIPPGFEEEHARINR